MISECPHCRQTLKFSEAQTAKLESALARLPAGGVLKLQCPLCNKSIEIGGASQIDSVTKAKPKATQAGQGIEPPKYPDVSWLASGAYQEQDKLEDIPMALVLVEDGPLRDQVAGAFVELFYQPVYPESVSDAIDRMQFVDFAAVVLRSGFMGQNVSESSFHEYMRAMAMSKRRYIFYILIGPEFHTLYDLEALSLSANLVVNEKDAQYLKTIVKKGMHDTETLFGPWISALKGFGNK